MSQTMVFRRAPTSNPALDGLKAEFAVVDDVQAALAEGWLRYRDFIALPDEEPEAAPPAPSFSLLDESAATIIAQLPELTGEELSALLEAEKNGKTRKGVIAALEKAIEEHK